MDEGEGCCPRQNPPAGLTSSSLYQDSDSAVSTNQYSLEPPFMRLMLLMVSQPRRITWGEGRGAEWGPFPKGSQQGRKPNPAVIAQGQALPAGSSRGRQGAGMGARKGETQRSGQGRRGHWEGGRRGCGARCSSDLGAWNLGTAALTQQPSTPNLGVSHQVTPICTGHWCEAAIDQAKQGSTGHFEGPWNLFPQPPTDYCHKATTLCPLPLWPVNSQGPQMGNTGKAT